MANGTLDALFLFVPQVANSLREAYEPMQRVLGTNTDSIDEAVRAGGHLMFLHGMVRICAGLNFNNKIARRLAAMSYFLEMTFALGPIVAGSKNHAHDKLYPIVVLPFIGLVCTLLCKDAPADVPGKSR